MATIGEEKQHVKHRLKTPENTVCVKKKRMADV